MHVYCVYMDPSGRNRSSRLDVSSDFRWMAWQAVDVTFHEYSSAHGHVSTISSSRSRNSVVSMKAFKNILPNAMGCIHMDKMGKAIETSNHRPRESKPPVDLQ